MISSNSRKIISLATSSLMVGASLVMASVPANAATGDVTIAPTSGVSYAVFNDDQFDLTTTVNGLTVSSDATLAYAISNPDQYTLAIDFETFDTVGQTVTMTGAKSTGEAVTVLSAAALSNTTSAARGDNSTDTTGYVVVDFAALDITSLTVSGMNFSSDLTPKFQILEDGAAATDDSGVQKNDDALNLIDGSAAAGNLSRMGLNDGNASISVQAWVDSNSDVTDIDAALASAAQTITWYDPANVSIISKIERMRATGRTYGTAIESATDATSRQDFLMGVDGATDSNALVGSLKFGVALNFAQIDLNDIKIGMTSTNATTTTMARTAIAEISGSDALDTNGQIEELTASNGLSADKNNEYLFRAFINGAIFAAGDKYNVSFQHSDTDADSNAAPVYNSAQFTVSSQTIDTGLDAVEVTVAPTADASASSGTVSLRAGVKSFTYTAQVQDNPADIEEANIPVTVRVAAGSFLPANETITVSGTTKSITKANQAVFVSGLTDADGQFSVTVTTAEGAAATDYSVQFYASTGATAGAWTSATAQTATYASANASTLTADNSVVSASAPTITFSVEDAFGEGVSKSSTGKQYSVELKAPDTDNLKAYGVVAADGTVSFSFTNWLAAGESDVLTAKLYTGTSLTPVATDYVSGKTANVTLYAPTAAKAVLFSADDVSGIDVEYNDFITGKKTTTVGPTSGTNSATLSGTVVDANGAGIPGAPVTLTADGIQFLTGTTFSVGSVDLVTDASGSFTVEAWTHVKTATGVTVTATSGTLTDTMLIKADLPSGASALDRGNLVFSTNLPASVVYNTTYAVTATLVDVWGNPVDGAVVSFDGFGGANFNGVSSVTRTTNRNGEATAYLRSIKDVDGLSALEMSVKSVDHDADGTNDVASIATAVATDVASTSWDETSWSNLIEAEVNFLKVAAASSDVKVNAGSFKGYVAVYAKGYKGQRLSAKVGKDWVIVPALASDFVRVVEFTGAGVDVAVRIYIDRVLVDTINLTTK